MPPAAALETRRDVRKKLDRSLTDLDAWRPVAPPEAGPRDGQRHQPSGPHELWSRRRPESTQQPPRGVVVFHDGCQVRRDAAAIVESAAEREAAVEQRPYPMAAHAGSQLAEITEPGAPAVDEDVALRPSRDPRDPAAVPLASHDRLVHVAFDRCGDRRVRFAFK